VYAFGRAAVRLAVSSFCRLWVHDVENIPAQGGALLAANHASFLDPPLVGVGVVRQLHFMARKSLFRIPLFGRVIRAVKAVPVKRGAADLGSIRACIRVLRSGGALVVFPEGTRTSDGEMQPFKAGFAMMAARAGVAIVPVAICGSYAVWPRHRALPRFGRVRVAYGTPVDPPERSKEACSEAAREVESRVRALYESLRRIM
jgi:1-acyl-sn-glycerol-3-phosphate acyltransferase